MPEHPMQIAAIALLATAVETEFGIRADTDMGNGVTKIEVLELIPA